MMKLRGIAYVKEKEKVRKEYRIRVEGEKSWVFVYQVLEV